MRFVCLGYMEESKWDTMSESERDAMIEECFAYDDVLRKNGHFAGGEALQLARNAVTLRFQNGQVTVTDGPYAETKEQLGGILVLEARDRDHAVQLMSKHPGVRLGGPFEIRPAHEQINALIEDRWKESTAGSKVFINLPVKDLGRSIDFFTRLGFKFNAQFTTENATCMIVGDDIFVMLLTETEFQKFTPKPICDATKSSEVLVSLSCESCEAVDDMVRKAVAAGGTTYAEAKDYGSMYGHGFQDPDGHIWELMYMDPAAAQQG